MATAEPFTFLGCLELKELLAYEAHDTRELLEQLERIPLESIFCHTSASLLHRPVLPEAYPNDFALWAAIEARDVRLAERLAVVDQFRSGSMEALREELVATVSDHLQHLPAPPRMQGETFCFYQIHLVPVPTGHSARTLREFRDALAEVDVSALFYHVIESRYRLGRGRGDFSEWVHTALGLPELA